MPHHGRAVAAALGLTGDLAKQAGKVLAKLYDAFLGTDASQIEINPLAVTDKGKLLVLDAKVGFDNNAEFRHPGPRAAARPHRRGPDGDRGVEIRPRLHQARRQHRLHGQRRRPRHGDDGHHQAERRRSRPTSSTSAAAPSKEKVTAAFKIILSDPAVKGILVNIFGGIMRCDIIAEGIVAAAREVELNVPLVVRLEGTNVQQGKDILADERACRSSPPTTSATPRKKIVAEVKQAVPA